MTAAEKKIHAIGTVTLATDIVIDRLRKRANKIERDGLAYVAKDELTAIADRLEELAGIAREYHTHLSGERADMQMAESGT